jgi:hypothetical protein
MRKSSLQEIKSQSAIEFLTTYGWALVIIVVVLAALYNVGIFSGNALFSTSCTAQVGYFCGTPILNSSGVVTVQFGETVGQITVVGIGCSNSSTQSPIIQPLSTSQLMQPGSKINVNFQCKIKSSSLGTAFSGFLWVNYTNQYGQKIEAPFAKFSAKVSSVQSTGGGSINPLLQVYVPITITNSQSSATASPFQEYVTFNPSSYAQYEANDLGNIRFYQGPIGTNELYSWCESGCSNSSTSAVFWIRLPTGISASTSIVANMSFGTIATRTTEYDGNFAGEAPNATSTYGQFDNGQNVFTLYQNFAGTSTPSGWTKAGAAINNGYTILGSGGAEYVQTTYSGYTAGNILDSYAKMFGVTSFTNTNLGYATGGNIGGAWGIYWTGDAPSQFEDILGNGPSGTQHPSNTIYHIFTVALVSNTATTTWTAGFSYDYGSVETLSGSCPIGCGASYYAGGGEDSGGTIQILVSWQRIRAYPPSGVMPTPSFGSVA